VLSLLKEIFEKYRDLLPLTLRQIFYIIVSLENSPMQNTKQDYARLCRLLSKARYSGEIPFEFIQDRTRYTSNLPIPLEEILYYYYPKAWEHQPYYIEVILEKEGLRTFFRKILRPFYVPVTPTRGFDSLSDVMEIAKRIHHYKNRRRLIFIFSDFDPSGESIFQDFEFRLKKCLVMLGEEPTYYNEKEKKIEIPNLYVEKVALTLEQIEKYNLPPKFVKPKDPRATRFIDKYGEKTVVEMDAMPPDTLKEIILEKVIPYLNLNEVERTQKIEKKIKTQGLKVLESLVNLEDNSHNSTEEEDDE